MEKIKVSYAISREAAIMAGRAEYGDVIVQIDPSTLSDEQRRELTLCRTQGGVIDLLSMDGSLHPSLYPHGEPLDGAVGLILDARIAYRAEQAAAAARNEAVVAETREREISECLANGVSGLLERARRNTYPETVRVGDSRQKWYSLTLPQDSGLWQHMDDPRIKALRDLAQAEIDSINAEREAEALAEAEKAEAERLAALGRRTAQIEAWIAEHGTESQRQRFAATLLPEAEVLDGMRAQVFAPIAGLSKYDKLRDADFCACEYTDDADIRYDVSDAATATADEFDALTKIRSLMPDATVSLRTHIGRCGGCERTAEKKSIRVVARLGEFDFSRELAI